jgi:predicted TIM-barrel fold metal-dependent hydrolase
MTDAHLHVVPPRLPGVGPLHPRLEGTVESVAEWLRGELADAGIHHCLAMGSWMGDEDDPLGVEQTLRIGELVPGLFAAGVCDPGRCDPDHIKHCESFLTTGRVKALKVYLGYLNYGPSHDNYRSYYELAERFQLPVVFHTGDTYSPFGRLKHAQPLLIDDVAVDHPNLRLIIAHCGNPWLKDAAAVVYKNVNVWADLSGLVIGTQWLHPDEAAADQLTDLREDVRRAFRYAERPNRFLFGSDWPLVPIRDYRELIAEWLPDYVHELVFEANARVLFRL